MLGTVVPVNMPAVNTVQCCSTVKCQERERSGPFAALVCAYGGMKPT